MNHNTAALIGGALGAVLGKMLYARVYDEEDTPTWVPLAGALVGASGGYHLAANNVGLMQALNNGKDGTGKIGREALVVLTQINPQDLYREEITSEVKIGEVYPNEKTVGTF